MKKIIIAEDEPILLDVLKDTFEEAGWEVKTVLDGEEAIAALDAEKYDVMLLDLLMPKKDGFEVLEYINSEPELKHLSIIVLSNLGTEPDINKAMDLGAKDYFIKTRHPMSEIVDKANQFYPKLST